MSAALFAAIIGLGVSLAATPAVATAARRLRLFDAPGGYKAHRKLTPLLGGLAVAAVVVGSGGGHQYGNHAPC